MIYTFFPSSEEMKSKSLMARFLHQIVAYEANHIFADTVISILVKRNPNYRDDPNEKCRIDCFLADRNTSIEGRYRLEELFESEWGEITEHIKKQIKECANAYAKEALEAYGWIPKTETRR